MRDASSLPPHILLFSSCSFISLPSIMGERGVRPGWTPRHFSLQRKIMSDPLSAIKKKLQQEIDSLEHELNVELPKEIAVARAHGDLSENAEYKFAKERQGYVNAKIGHLKKRMGDLGMLNLTNIPERSLRLRFPHRRPRHATQRRS